MSASDMLEIDGVVTSIPGHGFYKVTVEGGHELLATLCGKMRMHRISVQPDDLVTLHVSPMDLTRGVIRFRYLDGRYRR